MDSRTTDGRGPTAVARRTTIRTQRRKWRKAASHWDDHAGHDLGKVVSAVLDQVTADGPVD
ncbi:MAG TPA: hypothetical protein VKU91_09420, partial [Acidimicrobiales bacterium]|nr:hypothetical protein [Acidimicrobiales bacterium]